MLTPAYPVDRAAANRAIRAAALTRDTRPSLVKRINRERPEMTDMLVKLYGCEEGGKADVLEREGVSFKRAMAFDRALISAYVREQFETPGWVGECEMALSQQPPTCYVAVHEKQIIGFCCWDSTAKGMLGPLGVSASWRGRGVARELIHASLASMREAGYAYAIIGWVSSVEFYAKVCGAVPIADSHPGIYSRLASL